MILIQANQNSTVRIAAYLKAVVESQDPEYPGWQSAMHWCRREQPNGPKRKRHFHLGLRGIFWGIAFASIAGSALAWWWLIQHDHLQNDPHFTAMMAVYGICVVLVVVLFSLAYLEMSEGWTSKRFTDWQIHWERWIKSENKSG